MSPTSILRPHWLALLVYIFFIIGGVSLAFVPSPVVESSGPVWLVFFHVFLLLGSLVSLFGVSKRIPIIEAAGIPFLSSSFMAYAYLLLKVNLDQGVSGPSLGFASIMLGLTAAMMGRCVEMLKLVRLDDELNRRSD